MAHPSSVPFYYVALSEVAPVLTVETSVSPLHSLIDEDDKTFPSDGDLLLGKRRFVDAGYGVARVVDLMEGDFSLCETKTILIGDDIEPESIFQGWRKPTWVCSFLLR